MRQLAVALALHILLAPLMPARATNFVASVSGNINDGATYGNASPGVAGTDFPGSAADNQTILAQKTVTVPSGYAATIGSTTLNCGTAGTPTTFAGAQTSSTTIWGHINMGRGASCVSRLYFVNGSTLDLNGFNVTHNDAGFGGNIFDFHGPILPVTVRGGGMSQFGNVANASGGFNQVKSSMTNVNFGNMGDMVTCGYGTTDYDFTWSRVTWDSSGRVRLPLQRTTPAASRYIEDSTIINSTSTTVLTICDNNGVKPTGRNEIVRTVISSFAATTSGGLDIEYQAQNVTFSSNVIDNMELVASGANGKNLQGENNIVLSSYSVAACNPGGTFAGTTTWRNNFTSAQCDNPHLWNLGLGSWTLVSNVNEIDNQGTVTDGGDGIIFDASGSGISSGSASGNIWHSIRGGIEVLSMQGNANLNNFTWIAHETVVLDPSADPNDSCFRVGETYAGKSNMLPLLNDSICYFTSNAAAGHIVRDQNQGSSPQKISTSNYNAYWNVGGALYMVTGGTYGVNDVNADPQFVNSARTLKAFDATCGGPGTYASIRSNFVKLNGYGGAYNPCYNVVDALAFKRDGFRPQNTALKNAASDGGDIGALSVYVATTAATTSSTFTPGGGMASGGEMMSTGEVGGMMSQGGL